MSDRAPLRLQSFEYNGRVVYPIAEESIQEGVWCGGCLFYPPRSPKCLEFGSIAPQGQWCEDIESGAKIWKDTSEAALKYMTQRLKS